MIFSSEMWFIFHSPRFKLALSSTLGCGSSGKLLWWWNGEELTSQGLIHRLTHQLTGAAEWYQHKSSHNKEHREPATSAKRLIFNNNEKKSTIVHLAHVEPFCFSFRRHTTPCCFCCCCFEHFLTFLNYKLFGARLILCILGASRQAAISPRSLCFPYWLMVLETQI